MSAVTSVPGSFLRSVSAGLAEAAAALPGSRTPAPSRSTQRRRTKPRASTTRTRALLRGPVEPWPAPGVLTAQPREPQPLGRRAERAPEPAHCTLGGVVSGYLLRGPAPTSSPPPFARGRRECSGDSRCGAAGGKVDQGLGDVFKNSAGWDTASVSLKFSVSALQWPYRI